MQFKTISNIKCGDYYPEDGHNCSVCGNFNVDTLAVIKPKLSKQEYNLCKTCLSNMEESINKRFIQNMKEYKKV